MITRESNNTTLCEGLETILGDCDGAVQRDGIGFNKPDGEFVRSLLPMFPNWSVKMEQSLYKLLRKYKRQLSENGINFEEDIQKPATTERIITFVKKSKRYVVQCEYNTEIIDFIKTSIMPEYRSFDKVSKTWTVKFSHENRDYIKKMIEVFGFKTTIVEAM